MSTITSSNLSNVNKLVLASFDDGYKSDVPQTYTQVLDMITPERLDEKYNITEVGDGAQFRSAELAAYPQSSMASISTKTIENKEIIDSIAISQLMQDFDNYGELGRIAAIKGRQMRNKKASHAMAIFRNAFSTGTSGLYELTIDGTTVPLIGASQPVGSSGTTQSNLISGALNEDTLDEAMVSLMQQKSHDGNINNCMPSHLVVAPKLARTARQLTESMQSPFTGNNATNPFFQGIQVVIDNKLVDLQENEDTDNDTLAELQDNWFLMDRFVSRLVFQEKVPLEIEMDKDPSTRAETMYFRSVLRAAPVDYIGIVGSEG